MQHPVAHSHDAASSGLLWWCSIKWLTPVMQYPVAYSDDAVSNGSPQWCSIQWLTLVMQYQMAASQPKHQSTTYELRSFSYLGARLWNNIVKDFPFLCEIDYNSFREFVGQWGGPDLDDGFNYVWIRHSFIRIMILACFELYISIWFYGFYKSHLPVDIGLLPC